MKTSLPHTLFLLAVLLTSCRPAPVVPVTPAPEGTSAAQTLSAPTRTLTSKTTSTPQASSTPTPVVIDIQPSDLNGLSIEFWHAQRGPAAAVLQTLVDDFNSSNSWKIKVEMAAFPNLEALDERVRQAALTGGLPDLLSGYLDQGLRWETSGLRLVDLNVFLADEQWGLSATEQQDVFPVVWSQAVVPPVQRRLGSSTQGLPEQVRSGLPWYRSGLVLVYNSTWAKELGFRAAPDTPDEFRIQACAAAQANRKDADNGNDGTGGWMITDDPLLLSGWLHAFGAQFLAEDGGYQFATSKAEKTLRFLGDLYTGGCAWRSDLPINEDPAQAFASRRALFVFASLGDFGDYSAALEVHEQVQSTALASTPAAKVTGAPAAAHSDEWQVLPFPVANELPVIELSGPDLFVVQSARQIEQRQLAALPDELAAWLFARWLFSAETQARWASQTGMFPVRETARQNLLDSQISQQWRQALQWLPYGQAEPARSSWGSVRWALSDVLHQVFPLDPLVFDPDQAVALLKTLDQLAEEISAQVR